MTMAEIQRQDRNSRRRMQDRDNQDAARVHLEACDTLPDIVDEWWCELKPDVRATTDAHMLRSYALGPFHTLPVTKSWVLDYRRRRFMESAECDTLVDDMATDPQKEWPR